MNEKYSLIGVDGNAFSIMGYVREAMRYEKRNIDEIKAYTEDAMSGDYNHLIRVSMEMLDELNK